jgi:hypothetical protein
MIQYLYIAVVWRTAWFTTTGNSHMSAIARALLRKQGVASKSTFTPWSFLSRTRGKRYTSYVLRRVAYTAWYIKWVHEWPTL